MGDTYETVKVAAVQAASVFLSRAAPQLYRVHNDRPEALPDMSEADALAPPAPRLAGPDAPNEID